MSSALLKVASMDTNFLPLTQILSVHSQRRILLPHLLVSGQRQRNLTLRERKQDQILISNTWFKELLLYTSMRWHFTDLAWTSHWVNSNSGEASSEAQTSHS